jgi:hypothetical protein
MKVVNRLFTIASVFAASLPAARQKTAFFGLKRQVSTFFEN